MATKRGRRRRRIPAAPCQKHDASTLRELTEMIIAVRLAAIKHVIRAMEGIVDSADPDNMEAPCSEEEINQAHEQLCQIMIIAMRLAGEYSKELQSPAFERFFRERAGMPWEMPGRFDMEDWREHEAMLGREDPEGKQMLIRRHEQLRRFIREWREATEKSGLAGICGLRKKDSYALSVILGQAHHDERIRELPTDDLEEPHL